MTRILLGVIVSLALALGFLGWRLDGVSDQRDAARESVAALERQIAVKDQIIAQARSARVAAEAEAARQSARALEYDALREALIRGEDDAPLPAWLADWVGRLLGDGPR